MVEGVDPSAAVANSSGELAGGTAGGGGYASTQLPAASASASRGPAETAADLATEPTSIEKATEVKASALLPVESRDDEHATGTLAAQPAAESAVAAVSVVDAGVTTVVPCALEGDATQAVVGAIPATPAVDQASDRASDTAAAVTQAAAELGIEEPVIEEIEATEEVPPPPPPLAVPGWSPSERRRARVALPEVVEDDGPTYYRLGVDYEVCPEDVELHLQCARIKKLENLEAVGANLRKLMLIANCIEKIENLDSLVNLDHLELYQNLLKRIDNIKHLTNLTVLDFSFNKIRSIKPLADCPFEKLEHLYLSSNKIDVIEGVFHFGNLTMLELGSNRLREVPSDLERLTNLRELWLGKNKIASMALAPLPRLQHLSMQNNRLEVWDAALFQNCPNLSHLYLGHNNLPDLPEEFAQLKELREVDLAKNVITHIPNFPDMPKLQELWLNDNQVDDLDEIRHLAVFPGLRAVYLERNPMHGLGDAEKEKRYKDAILQAAPHIEQLDATHLTMSIKVICDETPAHVRGIRKR
eukprot:TRINITY_DN68190_c0_g1_i1.p1 TRINITY_DN68190_c0_g1~~TRINITY_DN68190_c0_g1_i1.p1  ORF type:complete len:529 (-),score=117.49 TRINITY_DN68190_c0_g1_i1:63-1649(-)